MRRPTAIGTSNAAGRQPSTAGGLRQRVSAGSMRPQPRPGPDREDEDRRDEDRLGLRQHREREQSSRQGCMPLGGGHKCAESWQGEQRIHVPEHGRGQQGGRIEPEREAREPRRFRPAGIEPAHGPHQQPGEPDLDRHRQELHRGRQGQPVGKAGKHRLVGRADERELVQRDRRVVNRRLPPVEVVETPLRGLPPTPYIWDTRPVAAAWAQILKTATSPVPGRGRNASLMQSPSRNSAMKTLRD